MVSHISFVDDSLLFARANESEAQIPIDILHNYKVASGQVVSLGKSEVS